MGDWDISSKTRAWVFFPNTSSSGDSKGKSSSTRDEFADEWENRVLPLLLVATDDMDWHVECVRESAGMGWAEFGGAEPWSLSPEVSIRLTSCTPSLIPSSTGPGVLCGGVMPLAA